MIPSFQIELEHIKIEILHKRGQHLRQFVDQWFCYKNGYTTNGGRAKWSEISFNEYRSLGIVKLLELYSIQELCSMKGTERLFVEKEHVIPLRVIKQKLIDLPTNVSLEEIENVLTSNVHFATITKQEDSLLNEMGLRQKMPREYYDSNSSLFMDPFARYKVCGIELIKPS